MPLAWMPAGRLPPNLGISESWKKKVRNVTNVNRNIQVGF
jgi:hypothetical protein